MPHQIMYTAESDGISSTDTVYGIMGTLESWAGSNQATASRSFDGIAFDAVNDGMRISIRLSGVSDINARLSDLDSFVADEINTPQGTSFPSPSETASIQPE